jgi:hypothetical protein
MTLDEVKTEQESRRTFRRLFCETPEGPPVLTWILNECGYFSFDPQLVDPLMIAFCNRLLNKAGIVHGDNLFTDTQARLEKANDRDLRALEAEITKREDV